MDEYRYTLTNLLTSEVKVLDEPPKEWQKMTRLFQRSTTYNSISRELTSAVKFPRVGNEQQDKAGYHFIINALDVSGIKAEMSFKREKRNSNTNRYEDDAIWIMDFDPEGGVPRTIDDVSVEMTDSSKLAKVMARDEIDVNVFSLESIDGVTVEDFSTPYHEATYTPIDIYLQCTFTGIFASGFNASGVSEASIEIGTRGTTVINEIGDRIVLSATNDNFTLYENTTEESSEYNLTELSGYNQHFIDIQLSAQDRNWTYDVYVVGRIRNAVGGIETTNEVNIMSLSGVGDFNTVTDIDYSDFPVVTGVILPLYSYELVLKVVWTHNADPSFSSISSSVNTYITSSDSFEKTDGEPENQIRGLLAYEYFTRILQLYTSELDTSKILRSNFLGRTNSEFQTYPSNGDGAFLFNTNGFQLRQKTEKALNGDLRNAFTSYDAMNALGMGYDPINDVFFIEPIEEFYKDEAFPFTIEDVVELEITFSKPDYWNNILAGYPKVEYEDFQGVNEYNTQSEYSSYVKSKTKINKRSLHFGDSIGAELARRLNEARFASKDSKYDNNNYIHLTDGATTVTTGYSGFENSGSYYNPGYTPRQNIKKHTGLLSAEFWKDATDKISWRKSLKDTNIRYNIGFGTSRNEFDNITASEMLTPFIFPEVYKFEGIVTQEIINEIKVDPHRYIPFTDTYGTIYYGYIISVEANDYEGKGIYTLIRANIGR